MKIENLFEQVSTLDSFDEKSGILANAVISSLPSPINDAALMCGLIYWFNEDIIRSFINDDTVAKEATDTILHLPFVEAKGIGFTFHESVRNGLRSSYEKEPDLTIKAYSTALPELLNNMEDDMSAITAAYGLIATNDSIADATIFSMLERFTRSHQLNKLKIFAQDLHEVLWLAQDDTLSDNRWVQIGWLQLSSNKLDDAIASCEHALRVHSSNEDAFLLRATVYLARGDFDTALNTLNETVSKFPKSVKAYLSRASLYILREEYSHASSDYYKVLDIDPKSSLAYMGLARIFKQKGNKKKQLSLYKQAIDLDPENIWIYLDRGTVLSEDGQYDEALSDFSRVLEINPAVDLALIGRATVYEIQEKYDLALADLQNALDINPDNVIALHKMSNIYYDLNKFQEALKIIQEILSHNPEYVLVYESLWKVYNKIGDIQQARIYFLKALDSPSQNSSYYFSLALTAKRHKEFELGILVAQKGIELGLDNARFYFILGSFYILIGELELAEVNINKAFDFKLSKQFEVDRYINLGVIRWLKGDKSAAWQMFQQAKQQIIQQLKEAAHFGISKKNASKKQVAEEQAREQLLMLGWLNIVMGQTEIGMSQIRQHIKNNPSDDIGFLDLRDSTNVILKLPDAPNGLRDLQNLIDDVLKE
jgi:tetratricopeptide (TPR) repeat protein